MKFASTLNKDQSLYLEQKIIWRGDNTKRFIRSNSQIVLGMSIDRKKAIRKMEGLGDVILEHICKCVMYGDSLGSYNYWMDQEIATWISYINDLTLKPNDKKLKAKEYDNILLGGFGDSYADARFNLAAQYLSCRKSADPYPEVDIDNQMINRMVDATRVLHQLIPELLASKNDYTKHDISNILHTNLDPILLN